MAKWSWLIALVLILSACGTAQTTGNNPVSSGGGPPPPIPGLEQTRVAGSAPSQPGRQATQAQQPAEEEAEPTTAPQPAATQSGENPPIPAQPTDTPAPPAVINTPTPFPTVVPTDEIAVRAFSAEAGDGLEITGSLYVVSGLDDKQPGVIILPMHTETRQAWDKYARILAKGGYTVLTLDLRGQGETGGAADWQQSLTDVQLVWQVFSNHKNVESSKTALLGASGGANVALNAAVSLPDVRTVVLISPLPSYAGLTTNDPLVSLGQRKILVISASSDPLSGDWSAGMQKLAPDSVSLELLDSNQHGTGLINTQPRVINTLQKWLDDTFTPPPSGKNRKAGILYIIATMLSCGMSFAIFIVAFAVLRIMISNSQKGSPSFPIEEAKGNFQNIELRGKVDDRSALVHLPAGDNVNGICLEVKHTVKGSLVTKARKSFVPPFTLESNKKSIIVESSPDGVIICPAPQKTQLTDVKAVLHLLDLEELEKDINRYQFSLAAFSNTDDVSVIGEVISYPALLPSTIVSADRIKGTHTTRALREGQRSASVQGLITTVLEPQDADIIIPLALRRLVVEEVHPTKGPVIAFERWRVSQFCLLDHHGKVWIQPDQNQLDLTLNEKELSRAEFEALLDAHSDEFIDDLDPENNYRFLVYEIRAGDEVTIFGQVIDPISIFSAREINTQPGRVPLVPVKYLQRARGRVAISGKVTSVEHPIERPSSSSKKTALALLRIDSKEKTRQGWHTYPSEFRRSRFTIEDSTGEVEVIPINPTGDCLGPGETPNKSRLESALQLLGKDPKEWGKRACTLWEIRAGQIVTVYGNVATTTARGVTLPALELAPSNQGAIERLRTWRPRSSQIVTLATILSASLIMSCVALILLGNAISQF